MIRVKWRWGGGVEGKAHTEQPWVKSFLLGGSLGPWPSEVLRGLQSGLARVQAGRQARVNLRPWKQTDLVLAPSDVRPFPGRAGPASSTLQPPGSHSEHAGLAHTTPEEPGLPLWAWAPAVPSAWKGSAPPGSGLAQVPPQAPTSPQSPPTLPSPTLLRSSRHLQINTCLPVPKCKFRRPSGPGPSTQEAFNRYLLTN